MNHLPDDMYVLLYLNTYRQHTVWYVYDCGGVLVYAVLCKHQTRIAVVKFVGKQENLNLQTVNG